MWQYSGSSVLVTFGIWPRSHFHKQVQNLLWFSLKILTTLLKWCPLNFSSWGRDGSLQVLNLVNSVGAEVIPYCFWWETHEWRELGDRMPCCYNEFNFSHSINLITFNECSPSDVSKCCNRILDWWSDPGGQILDAQYYISWSYACCRSSKLLIIIQGYSAFETSVQFKVFCMTHYFVTISLPKHTQCLRCRLPKFNAKHYVGSLFLSVTKKQTIASKWSQKNKFHNLRSKHIDVNQHPASWRSLLDFTVHATMFCYLLAHYRTSPGTFWYHIEMYHCLIYITYNMLD